MVVVLPHMVEVTREACFEVVFLQVIEKRCGCLVLRGWWSILVRWCVKER